MIDPMVLIVTGIGAAFLLILTDRVHRAARGIDLYLGGS